MKRKCLNDGTVQAYADGELSPELMREASAHLASCSSCAAALSTVEGEIALLSAAFAPDTSLVVPTETLRRRLDAAIENAAIEKVEATPGIGARRRIDAGQGLKRFVGTLFVPFVVAPQRAGALAALFAGVAFLSLFAIIQLRRPDINSVRDGAGRPVAATLSSPAAAGRIPAAAPPVAVTNNGASAPPVGYSETSAPEMKRPRSHQEAKAGAVRRSAPAVSPDEGAIARQKSVPGEEQYEQAIASLSRAIAAGGDAVLGPSMRADYERNLAVVDKAIAETRRAAVRNPQDADATQFLFSAYQSKVDLLMAVADQAQSSALGR